MSSLWTNKTIVVKQKMVRLVKILTFEVNCGTLIMVVTLLFIISYQLALSPSSGVWQTIILYLKFQTWLWYFHVNLKYRLFHYIFMCLFLVRKWFSSQELGFHGPLDICHVYHSPVLSPCHLTNRFKLILKILIIQMLDDSCINN